MVKLSQLSRGKGEVGELRNGRRERACMYLSNRVNLLLGVCSFTCLNQMACLFPTCGNDI